MMIDETRTMTTAVEAIPDDVRELAQWTAIRMLGDVWRKADAEIIACAIMADRADRARNAPEQCEVVRELVDCLRWFIDDIDSTRTVMLDFDANVEKSRAALSKIGGVK